MGHLYESIQSVEHTYSFFDRSYSFLMQIKFVSPSDYKNLFQVIEEYQAARLLV